MSLQPGTTLGPYDVTAKIGEGGMGEVYRARDTKLDRDVALKVLPQAFTDDPDRLARFEREAKVLASLNHPNIASIYGLEEADGVRALVLELVEGPTLADRIKQGPIPLDEVLPIAKQIAEALEAAHEAGVIHRDLKPANIKVRDDGTVKVLDFGLAKALDPNPEGDPSQSPTLTAAATQMGVIMGTAAYMSPEQAKGKPADQRSDVWAFGAVLYEMLAGQRAFGGEDVSDTLVAVFRDEPDWSALPTDVPAAIRQALKVCFQKEPRQRVRDISAVRLAMEGAFETMVGSQPNLLVAPGLGMWQRPIPAAILALVIAGGAGFVGWTVTRPAAVPAEVIRFAVSPRESEMLSFSSSSQDLAVSPNGTRIVYAVAEGPLLRLHLRSADQLVGTPLWDGEAYGPFFSPDGEWVGFLDQSLTTLRKVSIFGGPPLTLTESPTPVFGASWGTDDQIIFAAATDGLFRVSGGGGEPEALITQDSALTEVAYPWPSIIAGRQAVLFVTRPDPSDPLGQIAVLDLNTREVTHLGLAGVNPRYVSTGHLVYVADDSSLRAVPFDATSLEVTGNPVPLIDRIFVKGNGAANYDVSSGGRLVYAVGPFSSSVGQHLGTLAFVDRAGNATPFTDEQRDYFRPRMSPDGTRVAVEVRESGASDPPTHLWIVAVETGVATQFTFDGTRNQFALWTADSQTVVFASDRADGGGWGIYRKAADGSGDATVVLYRRAV